MKLSKAILHGAVWIGLAVPAAHAGQGATINQRKENQQDRIASGVNSGQLTAGETANLETKESALNKEEHNMRAEDNGKLTAVKIQKGILWTTTKLHESKVYNLKNLNGATIKLVTESGDQMFFKTDDQ